MNDKTVLEPRTLRHYGFNRPVGEQPSRSYATGWATNPTESDSGPLTVLVEHPRTSCSKADAVRWRDRFRRGDRHVTH